MGPLLLGRKDFEKRNLVASNEFIHIDNPMTLLHEISLKQIRYFVAVAEAKSFRKASDILNMSQPPLTQQIKALEQILGVELFDRSAKKIELTLAGEKLLVSAHSILETMNTSLEEICAIGRGLKGVIRVGITNDFIYSPHISRINSFNDARSEVPVEIYVNISPFLIKLLKGNTVDFILTVPSVTRPEGDFVERSLPPSRILALVPTTHRRAQQDKISICDLHDESLIDFPEGSSLPIAIETRQLIKKSGISPRITHITTNSTLASHLVAEQRGIALASEFSVPPKIDGVARIPFAEQAVLKHSLLHNQKHLHPALGALIEMLSME
ncbi:MAG: LysR substrate-binding domain-containing protein [Pseudomonadota bacterium]